MDVIVNSSHYFEGDFDGWTAIPVDWRLEVVRKLSNHCNFFAVDVAELADGTGLYGSRSRKNQKLLDGVRKAVEASQC